LVLEGDPLSCTELGWDTLFLIIDDEWFIVPCAPLVATTSLLPLGDHEIDLLANQVVAGSRAGWESTDATLTEHGEDVQADLTFEYFDEPEDQLRAIFASARDHYLASDAPKAFPASTEWTQFFPFDDCYGIQTPDATAWDQDGWNALEFAVTTPHRFGYRFTSSGSGTDATFEIEAAVDIDCDFVWDVYSMQGTVSPEGEVLGEDALTTALQD
jgi:hypothetical protein